MSGDADGCMAVVCALVVGAVIGGLTGAYLSPKAQTINPVVVVTTTDGKSEVTVNGQPVTPQQIKALRDTYDRLLADWPKEPTDGR